MALVWTIPEGPSIHVEIRIEKDVVCGTSLFLREERGLSWGLRGEPTSIAESKVGQWLNAYCRKRPSQVLPTFTLDGLTCFQMQTLDQIAKIPFGCTLSYKELSEKLGRPQGARASGSACGKNPIPLLIPCHRVIAVNRRLGGFTGGVEIKRRLLHFEGVSFI